jgi:hypothetical protein
VEADGTPWHRDHALADFCAPCHGGDPEAQDEATAHATLVAPLEHVDTACAPCHGADAAAFARRYASTRAVTTAPSRQAPPSPPPPPAGRRVVWGNVVLAIVVAALGLGGGSLVARNERRLGSGRP